MECRNECISTAKKDQTILCVDTVAPHPFMTTAVVRIDEVFSSDGSAPIMEDTRFNSDAILVGSYWLVPPCHCRHCRLVKGIV